MSRRTEQALDLANDVIEHTDTHRLWRREGHELAMTLACAVKALALEVEGLQQQMDLVDAWRAAEWKRIRAEHAPEAPTGHRTP